MAHRRRLHLQSGTYFIVQLGAQRRALFEGQDDYAVFEQLLARALARADVRALAYCWLPTSVHLAVQVGSIPLGRFLQGFLSRYASYIHRRDGQSGHLFADRYRALLLEPTQWLGPLIRYVHYLPVLRQVAADLDAYPHTSHHAYGGAARLSWLNIQTWINVLTVRSRPVDAYRKLVAQPPTSTEVQLFEHGTQSGVLGSEEFHASLPRALRTYHTGLSLEQIIRSVSILVDVDPQDLSTKSRRHDLALARALIAWHATERSIARLSDVARRFRRDPSTLSSAIARYRPLRPELFNLTALRHMTPLI